MNPKKLPLFQIALLIGFTLTSLSGSPEKGRLGRDISNLSPINSTGMNVENMATIEFQRDKGQLKDSVDIEKPIIGADISFVPQMEARGATYTDNGREKDVVQILKDHRFNWIRLRLFVDPTSEDGYSKEGYCGLEKTLEMAKRVKQAGMKFLLDFHYSDTWADPGKQFMPASWADLKGSALEDKIYSYTRETVSRFIEEGVAPEMVQIGNEIHNGILWPEGKIEGSASGSFYELLKRASEAVRDVDPEISIMVHIAKSHDLKNSTKFFDNIVSKGVHFDIIGQSC